MPVPGLGIELFLLSPTGIEALAPLAMTADYRRAVGISSRRSDGTVHPTNFEELSIGLEYRWVVTDGGFTITPRVAYMRSLFELEPAADGSRDTEFPNTSYEGPRFGAQFEVPLFSIVSLLAEGEFLRVLTPGEIISQSFLRAGTANAVLGQAGLRLDLSTSFALDVEGTVEHYFFAFDPQPGDRFIAGGALDDLIGFRVGLRLAL
jgi:hypothetical protein